MLRRSRRRSVKGKLISESEVSPQNGEGTFEFLGPRCSKHSLAENSLSVLCLSQECEREPFSRYVCKFLPVGVAYVLLCGLGQDFTVK